MKKETKVQEILDETLCKIINEIEIQRILNTHGDSSVEMSLSCIIRALEYCLRDIRNVGIE